MSYPDDRTLEERIEDLEDEVRSLRKRLWELENKLEGLGGGEQ